MDKSPEAFRTISEVAEALDTPAHVLRFWESRFPQIRPVKRAGGRRYYRPADVALLSGIRHLLHDQGMTIRGVQKVLREQGVRHVAALAPDLTLTDEEEDDEAFAASLLALREQLAPETGRHGDADAPAPEAAEPLGDGARIVELPSQAGLTRTPQPPRDSGADVLRLRSPLTAPPTAVATPPAGGDRGEVGDAHRAEDGATAAKEEVPEAGHIWVEDEPELALDAPPAGSPPSTTVTAIPLSRRSTPPSVARTTRPEPAPASMFDDIFAGIADSEAAPLKLSGLAARLRALPRPLSPEAILELTELHSRLGLLHAQIAEALSSRR